MEPATRALLRALGTFGAVLVVVATFVSWYSYEVLLPLRRAPHSFQVPVNLWTFDTLAAFLLLAGAVAAAVLLNLPTDWLPRAAGIAAAAIGLAMAIYSAIRCFDIPDLGVTNLVRPVAGTTPRARTHLDGGPLLALSGSIVTVIGSIGAIAPERPAPRRSAASPAS